MYFPLGRYTLGFGRMVEKWAFLSQNKPFTISTVDFGDDFSLQICLCDSGSKGCGLWLAGDFASCGLAGLHYWMDSPGWCPNVTVGAASASGAVGVASHGWWGSMGFALWLVYFLLFGGCGGMVLQVVAWVGLEWFVFIHYESKSVYFP